MTCLCDWSVCVCAHVCMNAYTRMYLCAGELGRVFAVFFPELYLTGSLTPVE